MWSLLSQLSFILTPFERPNQACMLIMINSSCKRALKRKRTSFLFHNSGTPRSHSSTKKSLSIAHIMLWPVERFKNRLWRSCSVSGQGFVRRPTLWKEDIELIFCMSQCVLHVDMSQCVCCMSLCVCCLRTRIFPNTHTHTQTHTCSHVHTHVRISKTGTDGSANYRPFRAAAPGAVFVSVYVSVSVSVSVCVCEPRP